MPCRHSVRYRTCVTKTNNTSAASTAVQLETSTLSSQDTVRDTPAPGVPERRHGPPGGVRAEGQDPRTEWRRGQFGAWPGIWASGVAGVLVASPPGAVGPQCGLSWRSGGGRVRGEVGLRCVAEIDSDGGFTLAGLEG